MNRTLRLGALLGAILLLVSILPTQQAHAISINVNGVAAAGEWPTTPTTTQLFNDGNSGTPPTIPENQDLTTVWFTNNETRAFFRYNVRAATTTTANSQNSGQTNYGTVANPTTVTIYLNTDNNTGTGQTLGNMTMQGVDRVITITGPRSGTPATILNISLESCDNSGCTPLAPTGVLLARAGTTNAVTELGVDLSDLGWTNPLVPFSGNFRMALSFTAFDGTQFLTDDTSVQGPFGVPGPLPVTLTSFDAARQGDGVVISWATATELDIAGYYILRGRSENREDAQRITSELIVGEGNAVTGASYSFTDTSAAVGADYYYWLEVINLNGELEEYGPVSSRPETSASNTVYLPFLAR